MNILFVGIDITTQCNPLSNLDFFHYFWDNHQRFIFHKYAITIVPSTSANTPPQMLCLQHYRARSDGWRDIGQCDDCVNEHQLLLLPYTDCSKRQSCTCTICVRQPPSLVHLAATVLSTFTVSLRRFQLNVHTTYQQYVYASSSPHVDIFQLHPPEFPVVSISFRCDQDSHFRFVPVLHLRVGNRFRRVSTNHWKVPSPI